MYCPNKQNLKKKQRIAMGHFQPVEHNLSNQKPGHTTGGSGRSARRSGWVGSHKIGCQQNHSPRKQKSTVSARHRKKRRFNVSPEERTSEILCKPTEEPNHRLTSGLSAVYERFICGVRSALCSWLPNSGTTPFVSKKTLYMQGMSGKTRTYHGRVGSKRTAKRLGGVRQDLLPTEPFAKNHKSTPPQRYREMSRQCFTRGTNKRNSM